MADSINMSLDDIIRQNRVSRTRGRGGGPGRGRGGGRGGRGRGGGRARSQTRATTPGGQARSRSRSRSRGPRGRSQSRGPRGRGRSQSNNRSNPNRRSVSRNRSTSRSRSQLRGLTPKGRAGLEEQSQMPPLVRNRRFNNRGGQNRLQRANSNSNLQGNIHSRLGMTTRRGLSSPRRPLAVAKRGISKRGRGLNTGNKYSNIGLRSDQILKEQRHSLRMQHNNIIKSQTFTRSRNNSFNSASQLTVSVANDFAKRRRNSVGNAGYLNRQSLAQLNNQFGGYKARRGPGSVKSVGSNRSNRSNRSNTSRNSNRSRGRGRGGGNRGIGRKFVNKQILNSKLQEEIAAIQGRRRGTPTAEAPGGVNFTPTPAATTQTLHQRFAST